MEDEGVIPSSIILHVDLDCFYAAVEQVRLGIPREQPLAVQQWEGLIAVNYAARAAGVVRHDRVSEALRKCPDLHLVHVETIGSDQGIVAAASRGSAKVSLERYRQASRCVFEIFHQHANICERASIDEAYMDITRQVEKLVEDGCDWDNELHRLVGSQRLDESVSGSKEKHGMIVENGPLLTFNAIDRRLLAGAIIAERIRSDVRTKLGYTCSVGIATNKLLAKIASARHKPDQQTLIPPRAVAGLMETLPLKKVKLLGGKIGEELTEKWGCSTAGEVQKLPLMVLLSSFGDRLGQYVWRAVRGIQDDKVLEKQIPKSMLAAKSFQATQDLSVIRKWLGVLAEELSIRMLRDARENHRQPRNLQLYYRCGFSRQTGDHSKSCSMPPAVLQLLSSMCSSTSRFAPTQPSGVMKESMDNLQDLESEAGPQNNLQSKTQDCVHDSEHRTDLEKEDEKSSKTGNQVHAFVEGIEGAITNTTKELAKLLQQASFHLFLRIEGAFPCTRLAIAASGYQDAPTQGSQSIQHFFAIASQDKTIAPNKPSTVVQDAEGVDRPINKPKGLLRYMCGTSIDSKQVEASTCSDDTEKSFSRQDDMESSRSKNSSNSMEQVDNYFRIVLTEETLLGNCKVASQLSQQKFTAESRVVDFSPGRLPYHFKQAFEGLVPETQCMGENASLTSFPVHDFFDKTTVRSQSSGQLQGNGEKGLILEDVQEQTDLTNVDVEEQRQILEEIYEARSSGKGSSSFGHKRYGPNQERQVAKHRKFTSSKPGQMSLSNFFNVVHGSHDP